MSATQKTPNLGLNVYQGEDITSWLTDFNTNMDIIDESVTANKTGWEGLKEQVETGTSDVESAKEDISNINSELDIVKNDMKEVEADFNTLEQKVILNTTHNNEQDILIKNLTKDTNTNFTNVTNEIKTITDNISDINTEVTSQGHMIEANQDSIANNGRRINQIGAELTTTTQLAQNAYDATELNKSSILSIYNEYSLVPKTWNPSISNYRVDACHFAMNTNLFFIHMNLTRIADVVLRGTEGYRWAIDSFTVSLPSDATGPAISQGFSGLDIIASTRDGVQVHTGNVSVNNKIASIDIIYQYYGSEGDIRPVLTFSILMRRGN